LSNISPYDPRNWYWNPETCSNNNGKARLQQKFRLVVHFEHAGQSRNTEQVDFEQAFELVDRHQACHDSCWPLDLEGHKSKNDLEVTNEDFGALQGHFEGSGIEDFLCLAHFLSHPLESKRSEAVWKFWERHDVGPPCHVEHQHIHNGKYDEEHLFPYGDSLRISLAPLAAVELMRVPVGAQPTQDACAIVLARIICSAGIQRTFVHFDNHVLGRRDGGVKAIRL